MLVDGQRPEAHSISGERSFDKIRPATVKHRPTRCFPHNGLSSWQDKIISVVQLPILKWHEKLCGTREQQEGEGWDHKVCPETEIMYYLWGKQEKTSDQCPSDFVLHFVGNYPLSNLKLYPDWQPSLILSAGWGQSVLSDSHYEDALTQFSLPASLSHMANRM